MSAVRAANAISPEPIASDADVQLMQDVLYDLLATGVDLDEADVPAAEIEHFLFEHARAPKGSDEFRSFFARHGLSVRARVHSPVGIALPDVTRANDDDSSMSMNMPVAAMSPSVVHDVDDDEVSEHETGTHRVDLTLPGTPRRRAATFALWGASLCVVALCAAGGWFGYSMIRDLRSELARASRQGREDRSAIHALQDHAVGLESSVAATGELVQRMDQKSDLLLQTVLSESKSEHRSSKRH